MNKVVLVVDDLRIIRDPIAATLKAAGYRALSAANGEEAFELLNGHEVALVLLDVKMPVMDGLTFLRKLRGDPSTSEIPVIMLSGAEDRQDILQAAKLGIRGYVLKSHFSLKDLMGRVTDHFSSLAVAPPPSRPQSSDAMHPSTPACGTTQPAGRSIQLPSTLVPPGLKGVTTRAIQTDAKIPSLLDRETCLARARRALHGRTLSGVVTEVISAAASPRGSASDLVALIARDPLLCARILQVANSPAYASARGRVSTLADAVRNIGSAAIRNVAAALGVFNAMPESGSDGFNSLRCWQHAFAVATLCDRLAGKGDSGIGYLVGLCHDLGEILFHSEFADEYRQVMEFQQATGKPRDEVERIVLGTSQGELLQVILECLDLPTVIRAPIKEHHSNDAGRSGSPMARLLRAADLYANGMLLMSSPQSRIRPITCAEANAVTGQDHPPALDRVAIRGEILALTATLSRFSEKQQAEVMSAPFPRQPVRVWLVRDPKLSSLDPLEAAFELLAEVTVSHVLPKKLQATEHHAIAVIARSTTTAGLTQATITQVASGEAGHDRPVLWLVGRADGATDSLLPTPWPITLADLAAFVASARVSSRREAAA